MSAQLRIREAKPREASHIIELLNRLYSETPFLVYQSGEMNVSVETYSANMTRGIEKGSWYMFLAEEGNELIGAAYGSRGYPKRLWHTATLGLGVLRNHWGKGAGRALIEAAEDWAQKVGVHRLELSVLKTNTRAMALYEKLGFVHEGIKRDGHLIDGSYIDEYIMSKILGHTRVGERPISSDTTNK